MQRSLSATLVAATLVAGCATGGAGLGGDTVTRVYQEPNYRRQDVSQAAVGGAPVVVLNPPAAGAQAVADRLRLPSWFRATAFQAEPPRPNGYPEGAIFVLQLNAGLAADGAGLCAGRTAEGGPVGAAHIVLCNDGAVIAEGRLQSAALSDPTSDAAAAAYRRLFRLVFPAQNRDRDNNNDGSPIIVP